ncbi:MAG: glycosyltransferase [Pyrinomonadaceae bacterium]
MSSVSGGTDIDYCEAANRPRVEGKSLIVDNSAFFVRGVTYGTFRPNDDAENFPSAEIVERDFEMMSSFGINAVRTYTVPPISLLDCAKNHGLRVLIGIPWEQHISFLDDKARIRRIEREVYEAVRSFANHPAILAYTLGNEIPGTVVRWYGHKRIENFLRRLYRAGKEADPSGLFTYVNFPTTEYLDTSFTDFDCFNVYLEEKENLEKYLTRLHNISGDRPLVMAEIGLDSQRNGKRKQAEALGWQISSVFSSGCAGAFVFAWTDEWWRSGQDIEDWDFGLTSRDREPKEALYTVSKAFDGSPFPSADGPMISVVVCSYNGSKTIRDCLEALSVTRYNNFEVLVVNDGSTDGLADIVAEYPVRLISTPNRGLSSARNTGMAMAYGEIVAYIDDDAYPDPYWLQYVAHAFSTSDHAGIGGPNIPPPGQGLVADSVANAPGGPLHVLATDEIAEHIPGCNMAFRRSALLDVGGCDPQFRSAGDDVDLCWRIQDAGYTIGFHPSAVVWHHRRNTVRGYWKQQQGYGKAEALLEKKWPQKYNSLGHVSWGGRIYGQGQTRSLRFKKPRIFHGVWGQAPFQSVYQQAPGSFSSILLMPEWHLLTIVLGIAAASGLYWKPMLAAFPAFFIAVATILIQIGISAGKAKYSTAPRGMTERGTRLILTAVLHGIQPLARLIGRMSLGLTPLRSGGSDKIRARYFIPKTHMSEHWSEIWRSGDEWLQMLRDNLHKLRIRVRSGDEFDRYDLEAKAGFFGASRAIVLVEDHGAENQLVRMRTVPRLTVAAVSSIILMSSLTAIALAFDLFFIAIILTALSLYTAFAAVREMARSAGNFAIAFDSLIAERKTVFEETADLPHVPVVEQRVRFESAANGNGHRTDMNIKTNALATRRASDDHVQI